MKTIKKALAPVASFLSLMLFASNQALAQSSAGFFGATAGSQPTATAAGTLGENVSQIVNYFLGFLGFIAVIFLIYAGVLMVTSSGDQAKVDKAKKIITYAIIGIVIIILSWTIVTFAVSVLG